MKKRTIEEQLKEVESCLANAEEYVARNVNVEGSAFLHFDDWKGKSGHPAWMKNFMIPTMKKLRSRKEKVLERIKTKAKDKNLTFRKRWVGD